MLQEVVWRRVVSVAKVYCEGLCRTANEFSGRDSKDTGSLHELLADSLHLKRVGIQITRDSDGRLDGVTKF